MKRETVAAIVLLALGLAAMVGDVTGIGALKGIASATGASPAPKVFSAVKGFETYSTGFRIEYDGPGDQVASLEITPEIYANLKGPYNRRNVYGAALAYGPVLAMDKHAAPMFHAITRYALCDPGNVYWELANDCNLDVEAIERVSPFRVVYTPVGTSKPEDLQMMLEISCD